MTSRSKQAALTGWEGGLAPAVLSSLLTVGTQAPVPAGASPPSQPVNARQ